MIDLSHDMLHISITITSYYTWISVTTSVSTTGEKKTINVPYIIAWLIQQEHLLWRSPHTALAIFQHVTTVFTCAASKVCSYYIKASCGRFSNLV